MDFKKQLPLIKIEDFKKIAINVKEFKSVPYGRKYEVIDVNGDIMHFIRKDSNKSKPWSFDLNLVYNAYKELDNFNTSSFKKYVPIRHSPARGLLFHLELLKYF